MPINTIQPSQIATFGADNQVDACLCNSQYSGANCDIFTTATNCPLVNTTNMDAQTGQQVIENGINGGQINPILETVEFTIASPQTATRKYTGFVWRNCKNINSTNSNALRTFYMPTNQSECSDRFFFGYLVSNLVSECGLQIDYRMYDGTREGAANNSWVRYRGDLNIYYEERTNVSLNNGANTKVLTRTGRLVTPVDVYILRLYTAELNVNTSILVSQQNIDTKDMFEIQAAITATTVKQNQTTATLEITIGVNSPYQITYIDTSTPNLIPGEPALPQLLWAPNGDAPDIGYACVLDDNDNCVSSVDLTNNAGLSNCTSYNTTAVNGTNYCWRKLRVMIVTDQVCSSDHNMHV